MTTYLTPGVYFEKAKPPDTLLPHRTDIAGIVGLAQRGPLHQPQRLAGWREFREVFGGFLPYANLAYSVRAFFENGGAVCWVVRVADEDMAQKAQMHLIDLHGGTADAQGRTAYEIVATSPGVWGNSLTISVQSSSLAATHHVVMPIYGNRLAVDSVAGFQPGSWVRLTQRGGPDRPSPLKVTHVDPALGVLEIDTPLLAGFNLSDEVNAISVQSLEFTLLVQEAGQVVERFENLAPDPQHRRFAPNEVNGVSQFITIEPGDGEGLPELPARNLPLTLGANGLRNLNIFDYIGTPGGQKYGLAALKDVDEVGMILVPDLMTRPQRQLPPARAPRREFDKCALDAQKKKIRVSGNVVDNQTGRSLPRVSIEASDGFKIFEFPSQADGGFSQEGLFPDNIELLFTMEGYETRIFKVLSEDRVTVGLDPIDQPPVLSESDVFYGQSQIVAQCQDLRDRFAIIDPPRGPGGASLNISGLQSWRSRFDTQFAALYYPWLLVRDPLQPGAPQGREVPPSGHVAGIYAATDLSGGVFRPPANRKLAFVEDVATQLDDAVHGVLNDLGINAIRAFPGRGIRILGARTMSSESPWKYVNVRRLMSMLEEVFYDGLKWAVFEPNNTQLRFYLKMVITNMVDRLWRRGAFAGQTADAAYSVRCDATTTTPDAAALGQVIAEVCVAPTVPYEFIVLRLGLTADELHISEV